MRAEQLTAFVDFGNKYMGTSHRQPPIKNLVEDLKQGLLDMFHAPAGYEIILGNGGASAFWDAATFSLVEKKGQALVHGEFGNKFANILGAPWLERPTVVSAEPGTRSDLVAESGVDVYAYPHNETSAGVVTDVTRVSGADADALMLTDATSAAGGLTVDAKEFDTYYFAPQKSFASDGGLWIALMSPAAIARAEKIKASGRWVPAFFDLGIAIENSRLDQTYNTPALVTLMMLADQINWMNENGGLSFAAGRSAESAAHIYGWAEKTSYTTPFVTDPAMRSNVVATINFDESIDAMAVAAALRINGIVDTEPYRKLGKNQLRVGMFPAIDPSDVKALTACIDYVVAAL